MSSAARASATAAAAWVPLRFYRHPHAQQCGPITPSMATCSSPRSHLRIQGAGRRQPAPYSTRTRSLAAGRRHRQLKIGTARRLLASLKLFMRLDLWGHSQFLSSRLRSNGAAGSGALGVHVHAKFRTRHIDLSPGVVLMQESVNSSATEFPSSTQTYCTGWPALCELVTVRGRNFIIIAHYRCRDLCPVVVRFSRALLNQVYFQPWPVVHSILLLSAVVE